VYIYSLNNNYFTQRALNIYAKIGKLLKISFLRTLREQLQIGYIKYNTKTNFRMMRFVICFIISLLLVTCGEKKDDPEPETNGKIKFIFSYLTDNQPIEFDTLIYENAAGNPYLVNEIQYFISDVKLYKDDGSEKLISDWNDIHYIDTDLPETQTWEVYDPLAPGSYDSISFIFGITEEKNISFMFVNPPESFMFWPEYLGGGYHYLKLNGKWLEDGQVTQNTPFDFHLGRGQEYFSYPDSITGFIPNFFRVSLPNSGFKINSGQTTEVEIVMHIENWFKEPNIFNLDIFGGYIMQNQEAMQIAKENGHNVFSVKTK